MYQALRAKISLKELLQKASSLSDSENMDSLMNLVMQFRKVCNHPELFERAEVIAPFTFCQFGTTSSIARESNDLAFSYSTRSLIDLRVPRLLFLEYGSCFLCSH